VLDLDRAVCDRARRSRDARFDGRFFIAVTSTRVYCRPICPARAPRDENVRYFATAAAAEAAGFRPCLRCRPEASPGSPAWCGTSGVVSRALRLIDEGALDDAGVEALAERLGVTGRHLRRLFVQHLGASPLDVALTRRSHFAKKLLDETDLPLHQVAVASGFGSVRRFNSQIRKTYQRTPTELRNRAPHRNDGDTGRYCFRLVYRPPYDWAGLLDFLRARAVPGVESVDQARYQRNISIEGEVGTIEVSHDTAAPALRLVVAFPGPHRLLSIVERVRAMFDLNADPTLIADQLNRDPRLGPLLTRYPGIRTPGAWDGFELAVRAILGQQVSVRAGTTIAGRVATMSHTRGLFPTPERLANAPMEKAGVMPARADTIRALARAVASGVISLDRSADSPQMLAAMKQMNGIGDWTAQYVAIRAFNEPDAFPSGDLVLRRAMGNCSARELERRSQSWRPWRAYAVMLLWKESIDGRFLDASNGRRRQSHRASAADRHR
jgi:AraC family transcriptional regulator, regulatory protein of adaptative response / DNA-3-methyladenine glycosylase II